MYVGVKKAGGTIPNKISDIKNFCTVIKLLYKFKVRIQKVEIGQTV